MKSARAELALAAIGAGALVAAFFVPWSTTTDWSNEVTTQELAWTGWHLLPNAFLLVTVTWQVVRSRGGGWRRGADLLGFLGLIWFAPLLLFALVIAAGEAAAGASHWTVRSALFLLLGWMGAGLVVAIRRGSWRWPELGWLGHMTVGMVLLGHWAVPAMERVSSTDSEADLEAGTPLATAGILLLFLSLSSLNSHICVFRDDKVASRGGSRGCAPGGRTARLPR